MRLRLRRIRVATLLIVVAVCAVILGLGVRAYRAWSPVRRYIRESRPGNPQYTRLQAVIGLGYNVLPTEREEAFPVLLAAAKDRDPMIRAAAANALRFRRDRFAEVFAVLRGLMKDPAPSVREAAILHLESFVKPGSPEMSALLPDLAAALEDPRPAVRLEACRAFLVYGRLQKESRRIVPAMARLVREETGTHRRSALGYLLMIKTIPKDLEPVLRADQRRGSYRPPPGTRGADPARHARCRARRDARGHAGESRRSRAARGGGVARAARQAGARDRCPERAGRPGRPDDERTRPVVAVPGRARQGRALTSRPGPYGGGRSARLRAANRRMPGDPRPTSVVGPALRGLRLLRRAFPGPHATDLIEAVRCRDPLEDLTK